LRPEASGVSSPEHFSVEIKGYRLNLFVVIEDCINPFAVSRCRGGGVSILGVQRWESTLADGRQPRGFASATIKRHDSLRLTAFVGAAEHDEVAENNG
jgi:hypothetical protein